MNARTSAVQLGQVLGHGFIVGPELGRGGMGAVHAVTAAGAALSFHADLVPRHALVVKCVGDPEAIPRLLEEDRVLTALCHPGFPQHLASGWDEASGTAWSVRTRIPGIPLEPGAAGAAEPATLVAIALSLTAALDHLHRLGYVHGDLAPSNTLWDADTGIARVLDLGTAVRADGAPDDGTTSGVLAYAAPECLRGGPPTPRSDVWALGALLFGLAAPLRAPDAARRAPRPDARRGAVPPTWRHGRGARGDRGGGARGTDPDPYGAGARAP